MANNKRVCPVEGAGGLDNRFRRLFQNPNEILERRIQKGMTIVDLGCGPGFFSIAAAELVGVKGKVIAVDMQEGMLSKVRNKIRGTTRPPIPRLGRVNRCLVKKHWCGLGDLLNCNF